MAANMIPDNQHKEIPGNPSTAKSSILNLRKEATADSLRVLSMDDWNFWKEKMQCPHGLGQKRPRHVIHYIFGWASGCPSPVGG